MRLQIGLKGVARRVEKVRQALKRGKVRCFRTEAQRIDALQRVQNADGPPGEALRIGKSKVGGQLYYQVGSSAKRHPGARPLVEQRRFAALHEVAAQQGDHFVLRISAGLAQVVGMAAVKGIVFCDDRIDFHKNSFSKHVISCIIIG